MNDNGTGKGGGWNRGGSAKPVEPVRKPAIAKGAIAGLVLIAAVGIAAWVILGGGSGDEKNAEKRQRGRIKEVTPAPAPKAKEEPKVEKPKKVPFWEVPKSQTNGFSEAMQLKWRHKHYPPPCYTNRSSLTQSPPSYAVFNHPSENRIACYLTIEPGQTMVGTPHFGKDFERDFLKSCEEPIIVSPDDSEETKALKELMKQTKIELRQRMADGESLGDILAETHNEVQKLGAVKREIEALAREQVHEAMSEEEADDIIAAANKMLEDKGIAPISMSPITRRNIKRRLLNGTR